MAINKRIIKSNDGGAAVPTSFNTVTYTGTGTTNPVTGVGFQPDLVWIKNRDTPSVANGDHYLVDTVRGNGANGTYKNLKSNLTEAEADDSAGVVNDSIIDGGFTLKLGQAKTNASGDDYVAWCWKAGGAAVTNTDGTITSQVSANPGAGFSIVTYTGNGTANSTIGHGLGVKPDIVLVKARSAAYSWQLYSSAISTATYPTLNGRLHLDNTLAAIFDSYTVEVADNTFEWTGLASTFEYFNQNSTTYVAYCFAEVAGFSKFGSYTGDGSTSGPTIDCGFEPAFVMVKCSSDSGTNWTIWDNKRDTTNPITNFLQPNNNGSEATGREINFNPTSFQLKSTGVNVNQSGLTYIYMAFANQF